MVLEALTALSLAGSVIQFVDFSSKLVSKGCEIYYSVDGASVGNAELEFIATDLQHLSGRLDGSVVQRRKGDVLTPSQEALLAISQRCSAVAQELIDILNKLKTGSSSNRRWKSYRQALKSLLKKPGVDEISARLQSLREELHLHVLVSLRDDIDLQSIQQSKAFQSLEESTQALTNQLIEEKQQLLHAISEQTNTFTNQQNHTIQLLEAQHVQTRQEIIASIQKRRHGKGISSGDMEEEDDDGDEHPEKISLVQWLILESLRFQTMDDRYEEIEHAHKATFEWIFQEPDPQYNMWASFPKWLSTGSGIYWVNGKAASGKSTIMRFIFDDPRTRDLLAHWSQRHELIKVSHFFWNSGASDQRSYVGLLRALLFKILSESEHLIRDVFPEIWKERITKPMFLLKDMARAASISWSISKLSRAFELLVRSQNQRTHFCLFVDGLDEYDGDYFDVVKIFTQISQFPNVKVCLSSRPLADFVIAFKECPSLRLQDLTFNDIKQYINDELEMNHQMQTLLQEKPTEAKELVLEIVNRADGVFLWVKLVVLSLLRGLRYGDQIKDLHSRLNLLPPTLEELFSHILGRLDPVYLEQSSRIFQIFAEAQKPDVTNDMSRTSRSPLTSLELSFAEDQNVDALLGQPTRKCSDDELVRRREQVEIWLRTRCGGLIEAHYGDEEPQHCPLNARLSYLHRTVRDFLELPEIWTIVLRPMVGKGFLPSLNLLQSQILYIKNVLPHPGREKPLERVTDLHHYAIRCMEYAARTEKMTGGSEVVMLDELDRVGSELVRGTPQEKHYWTSQNYIYEYILNSQQNDNNFMALAVKAGLYHYVAEKLEAEPWILRTKEGKPLLQYAVQDDIDLFDGLTLRPRPDMVQLLLSNGADVNELHNKVSAWEHVLRHLRLLLRDPILPEADIISKWLAIVKMFLDKGADPAQCIEGNTTNLAYNLVNAVSSSHRRLNQEASEILKMLVSPGQFAERGLQKRPSTPTPPVSPELAPLPLRLKTGENKLDRIEDMSLAKDNDISSTTVSVLAETYNHHKPPESFPPQAATVSDNVQPMFPKPIVEATQATIPNTTPVYDHPTFLPHNEYHRPVYEAELPSSPPLKAPTLSPVTIPSRYSQSQPTSYTHYIHPSADHAHIPDPLHGSTYSQPVQNNWQAPKHEVKHEIFELDAGEVNATHVYEMEAPLWNTKHEASQVNMPPVLPPKVPTLYISTTQVEGQNHFEIPQQSIKPVTSHQDLRNTQSYSLTPGTPFTRPHSSMGIYQAPSEPLSAPPNPSYYQPHYDNPSTPQMSYGHLQACPPHPVYTSALSNQHIRSQSSQLPPSTSLQMNIPPPLPPRRRPVPSDNPSYQQAPQNWSTAYQIPVNNSGYQTQRPISHHYATEPVLTSQHTWQQHAIPHHQVHTYPSPPLNQTHTYPSPPPNQTYPSPPPPPPLFNGSSATYNTYQSAPQYPQPYQPHQSYQAHQVSFYPQAQAQMHAHAPSPYQVSQSTYLSPISPNPNSGRRNSTGQAPAFLNGILASETGKKVESTGRKLMERFGMSRKTSAGAGAGG